ncbi:MAG TPA: PQQ-binding-like beta-propeller repeat protein [Thermoanaerobaculia bacterium]|nr:PQQ-binding-like beta-propeller repeat protein [Thermoanaerobaculia bacterium]
MSTPALARPLVRLALSAVLLSVLLPGVAAGADWPQYRGPARDGRSAETGLLAAWPMAGPQVLWRAPLGDGYSGMAVAGGRVYTVFGAGRDEIVIAFDAATGKEVWRQRLDGYRSDDMGGGPRSTPTVAGGLLYALSSSGRLAALDAATGEGKWEVDLVAAYGARIPQWGVSISPLVEGDLLLLDVGGKPGHSLVALNKTTGKLAWAAESGSPGYSAPLAVTAQGVRQVLFFTGAGLVSVDPAVGKPLWRFPWKTDYDVNAAMPVFLPPDRVFISSSYGTGAALLRIEKQGSGLAVQEVWRSKVMKNHFNSSVLVGDHLYGFDDGTLKCIVAATGEEKWRQRGFNKGSLLYADGRLLVLSEQGVLALVEASPEAYRETGRMTVFTARTWTMPSLADGRLFVRSGAELVALKVSR